MFHVLFVCTGNICRSPTAERLLRHRLAERFAAETASVLVESAGTGALVGEPIQAHAAALLVRAGADPQAFSGRDVTAELVRDADLVLAMTRRHRAQVATLQPAGTPRLFTLREFARLAHGDGDNAPPSGELATRFAALVETARARRGLHTPTDPADDDVPDPYGGPASAYDVPFRLISEALDAIVSALG